MCVCVPMSDKVRVRICEEGDESDVWLREKEREMIRT